MTPVELQADLILDIAQKVVTIFSTVAAGLGLPGIILWYLAGKKKREEGKQLKEELMLRGLFKIGQLTWANSLCIQEKKVNGEMSRAMDGYEPWLNDMEKFVLNKASEK